MAVHVQSRAALMASDPLPPLGPNEDCPVVTDSWHFSDVGATTDTEAAVQ